MVTDRDREIVRLLDRSGGLDAPCLRVMLGLGHAVVYRRLARLEEYGMVRAIRPFRNTPALYIPSRRGLRELLGLEDVEPPSISTGSYNHQLRVGQVIAQLHAREMRWESSRMTRRNQRIAREAGEWGESRRYALTLSQQDRSHLPDALIWPSPTAIATGQPAAIEVELTLKTRRRLDEILDGYATHLGMCGVVYVCAPETREAVLAAVDRGGHQSVVSVTTLQQFGPGIALPPRAQRSRPPVTPSAHETWMDRHLTSGPISELERHFRRSAAPGSALTLPGI